ncbi:MAG: AAA family ATPase [Myxococcota bacterium]
MQDALVHNLIVNSRGKMPVGVSDFAKLVQGDYCFVDKSLFIKELLDSGDDVSLITRPRRFGKTMNLNMLRCFLHWPSNHQPDLFEGLAISRAGERYLQERGKRPVLFLTLKDIKAQNWHDAWIALRALLADLAESSSRDAPVNALTRVQQKTLYRVIEGEAEPAECRAILAILTKLLTLKHNGLAPWILMDEYDTPMLEAYHYGYYDHMRDLIRGLLGQCLKDNPDPMQPGTFLHKAVITGIVRVAKEDIFSDLNNLGVYGILEDRFSPCFGFTEPEVRQLLAARKLANRFDDVRAWYDGYRIGADKPVTIYNPWSLTSYLANPTDTPRPYWVNTSSNELVHSMVETRSNPQDKADVETLLLGGTIKKDLSNSLALRDLPNLSHALWNILLTSGYVTAAHAMGGTIGSEAVLRIPNQEVRIAYGRLALRWFSEKSPDFLPNMLRSLEEGEVEIFAQELSTFAQGSLSYFDFATSQPERVYHALMVGLVAGLSGRYRIRSNRESGAGRPDLLLIPYDAKKLGIVMEFKVVDSEDKLQQAAQTALEQILQKDYADEFGDDKKSPPPLVFGIAFAGKQVQVKHKRLA